MTLLAGKYVLGQRIGCGGMAEVFEGVVRGAAGFRRPVAIKRVHPTFSDEPGFAELFIKEAVLCAQLDHPAVVSVLDFDRDESGRLFLVMERVGGPDLRRLMRSGSVPIPVAVHIGIELLRGLRHAHELGLGAGGTRGILHRDVSPHNVLLSWEGAVKLSDFGIAKAFDAAGVSCSGGLKGKLSYMSPEQAQGQRLDGRSDLFALGALLCELVTGVSLARSRRKEDIRSQLFAPRNPPPASLNPQVPADVDAVVTRLMEPEREARYRSAREALAALQETGAAAAEGSDAIAATLRERLRGGAEMRGPVASEARPHAGMQAMATEPARPARSGAGRESQTATLLSAGVGSAAGARSSAPRRTRGRRLAGRLATALARSGVAGRGAARGR